VLACVYLFLALTEVAVFPPKSKRYRPPIREKRVLKTNITPASEPQRDSRVKDKESDRPIISIVIDDLGHNISLGLEFIRLDLPLSLAILPSAPHTDALVREAARKGLEVMLHQPMEPKDYPCVNPGPGALLLSMNARELTEILNKNLRQVPVARGMNNHMGSSFTESPEKMSLILHELKKKGLYYLDSRTTKKSVGLEQAKKLGVPAAERTIFLDNDPSPMAIGNQIEELIRVAQVSGAAIGIGHPYRETIEIIHKYEPTLKRKVRMVPVSELIREKNRLF